LFDAVRQSIIVPIHRVGWPFIAAFAAISLLLFVLSSALGAVGVLATAWCAYFFRNPDRLTPTRQGLVISPADGIVSGVADALPPAGLGLPQRALTRISIFLNIFDVHINRAPVNGTVGAVCYRPGKFVNACLDKASQDNERNALRIDMPEGPSIVVVQIAGLLARRICCWITEGRALSAGERFGLIRFGSRVDVYLPAGVAPLVAVGQRCIGGETVIADLRAQEPARHAERR
jgi:phosphatidylserine decarboxylase